MTGKMKKTSWKTEDILKIGDNLQTDFDLKNEDNLKMKTT